MSRNCAALVPVTDLATITKDMRSEVVLILQLMVVLLIDATILTNVYSIQIFVIHMALAPILMAVFNVDVGSAFKVHICPNMNPVYSMTEVPHSLPPKLQYANLLEK